MAEELKTSLVEKLAHIQTEMKVPKSLYNKFGKFNYRNAEAILEVAKHLCFENRTTLTVCDYIYQVNDTVYIKAVATIWDWDSDDTLENVAYAREPKEKSGMDASQITGSTSSYARKYALNGLFCLDDVKDADADEPAEEMATKNQRFVIETNLDGVSLGKYLKHFGVDSVDGLTRNQAQAIIDKRGLNG